MSHAERLKALDMKACDVERQIERLEKDSPAYDIACAYLRGLRSALGFVRSEDDDYVRFDVLDSSATFGDDGEVNVCGVVSALRGPQRLKYAREVVGEAKVGRGKILRRHVARAAFLVGAPLLDIAQALADETDAGIVQCVEAAEEMGLLPTTKGTP